MRLINSSLVSTDGQFSFMHVHSYIDIISRENKAASPTKFKPIRVLQYIPASTTGRSGYKLMVYKAAGGRAFSQLAK